jgi:hypothetical protein
MDLQEQRLTCLRMALEMGCKADSVVSVASDLLAFLSGGTPAAAASTAEEKSEEVIAACGTALAASEAAELVAQAEPAAAADTPADISREDQPKPASIPCETPAEMPAAAAADTEGAGVSVAAETAGGTAGGLLPKDPAPTSEQSRTEPALAADAKVADEEHARAQATEEVAVSNGIAEQEVTGTVAPAG